MSADYKISKFWQELKRRKVVRVVTMYGATAFIILEAVDIVFPRWGLPDWSVNLVILLLIIGFIVTAVLAWIFDITPEGIVKTDSSVDSSTEKIKKSERRKLKLSDIIIIVLFIIVIILIYPKIWSGDEFESLRDKDGRITVAVMPFENLTGDKALDFFQRGISTIIINELGTSEELLVLDDQTISEVFENSKVIQMASVIPAKEREMAMQVKAGIYITGNYQGSGSLYRISVNVIDTKSGEIIFGENITGDLNNDYLILADSLSNLIKNRIEIKKIQENIDYDLREVFTDSPEAYEFYIAGVNSISVEDYGMAVEFLNKALEIDSTFTFAAFYLAWAYNYNFENELAKNWTQKAYSMKDNLPIKYQLWLELWKTCYFDKDLDKMIYYCEQLEKTDIKSRYIWFDLGATYSGFPKECGKLDKAMSAFDKVMEISLDWGGHWEYLDYYLWFGDVCHWSGEHEKESKIYNIGLELFPDNQYILMRQAICALDRNDNNQEKYVEQYTRRMIELGLSQPEISFNLGKVYSKANLFEVSEKHFRNAYNADPDNIQYIVYLSRLLIEQDIDVSEGLELANKTLDNNPSNKNLVPHLLQIQGWGYYKTGEYHLALQSLNNAKDQFYFYDHKTNLYTQEVEKAIEEKGI